MELAKKGQYKKAKEAFGCNHLITDVLNSEPSAALGILENAHRELSVITDSAMVLLLCNLEDYESEHFKSQIKVDELAKSYQEKKSLDDKIAVVRHYMDKNSQADSALHCVGVVDGILSKFDYNPEVFDTDTVEALEECVGKGWGLLDIVTHFTAYEVAAASFDNVKNRLMSHKQIMAKTKIDNVKVSKREVLNSQVTYRGMWMDFSEFLDLVEDLHGKVHNKYSR